MLKFRGITILLIICMLTSGCSAKKTASTGNTTQTSKVQANKQADTTKQINLIRKKYKTQYLLSNGIDTDCQEKTIKTSKGEVTVSIYLIKGLVDKQLQNKINNEIVADVTNAIKRYADEIDDKPENGELWCSVELNANNLFSISVEHMYSPPFAGYLYRLTDGKRLSLKDIFTEGSDYVSLLNPKIIEGIMRGERGFEGDFEYAPMDEDSLEEPFSTINPDQDFVLSSNELKLIFHPDECGFSELRDVSIPLTEIDDYVNVMDIYSGTERKTQEKSDLIIRNNNIFTTEKGKVIKKKNGNVWVQYIEVSGLRNDTFQSEINKKIQESINEVINSNALDGLTKNPDQTGDKIATIEVWPVFNQYGILSINRSVSDGVETPLDNLNKIFSYDLIKKKSINPKDILKNFLKKNGLEDAFANAVKKDLKSQKNSYYGNLDDAFIDGISYSFIMDNGLIGFSAGGKAEVDISLDFKGNIIKGATNGVVSSVNLSNISKATPEEFFAE